MNKDISLDDQDHFVLWAYVKEIVWPTRRGNLRCRICSSSKTSLIYRFRWYSFKSESPGTNYVWGRPNNLMKSLLTYQHFYDNHPEYISMWILAGSPSRGAS